MTEYSIESGEALDYSTPDDHGADISNMVASEEYVNAPLASITPSLTNPRKTFDAVKLAELAASIKASGVHMPVLLRPLPGSRLHDTERGVTHELVAGERRLRASKLAGVKTIPAVIRHLTDNEVLEIQIIENLQRDDLSALEEAEGYDHLCTATGISKEDIGNKIGKSRAYVYARIKLLDLSSDCKNAMRTGAVDYSRALLIARVPDTALQQKALAYATATNTSYNGEVPSLRQFQVWLQSNVMLRLDGAPFNITDPLLCKDAGSCKDCPKRTGANPDLFSEIDSADVCTDPPCYQVKEATHHANLVAMAEAKGLRVIDGKEAKAIFRSSFDLGGYTRLDQRRQDISDDSPTMRKLLGDELGSLKPVVIEHPTTKELIEAVPTAEAEAMLITRGLIKQSRKADSVDKQVEYLKASIEERVKKESRRAIFEQLVKDVHARHDADSSLIGPELLRAWLIDQNHDMPSEDTAKCLNMPWGDESENDDEAMRLRIQNLSDAGLWKALAITLIQQDHPDHYRAKRSDTSPAFEALAKVTDTDLDQITKDTRTEIKSDVAAKIKALKAEAIFDKTTPRADVATTKGEGGAKQHARKSKTSVSEAQAAIAAAMQAAESEINTGAAIASQGNEQAATARPEVTQGQLGLGFAVGQRVTVTRSEALALKLCKYKGKEGTVTEKQGDSCWWVSFKGRTGGIACFDQSEIEVAA